MVVDAQLSSRSQTNLPVHSRDHKMLLQYDAHIAIECLQYEWVLSVTLLKINGSRFFQTHHESSLMASVVCISSR